MEITSYVGALLIKIQIAPKGARLLSGLLPDCGRENHSVLLGQRAAKRVFSVVSPVGLWGGSGAGRAGEGPVPGGVPARAEP